MIGDVNIGKRFCSECKRNRFENILGINISSAPGRLSEAPQFFCRQPVSASPPSLSLSSQNSASLLFSVPLNASSTSSASLSPRQSPPSLHFLLPKDLFPTSRTQFLTDSFTGIFQDTCFHPIHVLTSLHILLQRIRSLLITTIFSTAPRSTTFVSPVMTGTMASSHVFLMLPKIRSRSLNGKTFFY